jgi:hypothetical protein
MHFAEHNEEERKQKGLFNELTVSQRQVSFEMCKPVYCARVLGCCRVRAECRQLFRHYHVLAPSVLRSGGARILSCSEFRKPALHPGIRHFHCANELDVSHQVRVSALGQKVHNLFRTVPPKQVLGALYAVRWRPLAVHPLHSCSELCP